MQAHRAPACYLQVIHEFLGHGRRGELARVPKVVGQTGGRLTLGDGGDVAGRLGILAGIHPHSQVSATELGQTALKRGQLGARQGTKWGPDRQLQWPQLLERINSYKYTIIAFI